jgi:DNA mismatch repair protein MutL
VPPEPALWSPAAWGRSEGGQVGGRTSRAEDVGTAPRGSLPSGAAAAGPGATFFGALAYIGQLQRTYLVCEREGELVLVDQHAAHERVVFHRLRRAHAAREIARQRLLFPIPIELEETGLDLSGTEIPAALDGLGFDVEPFGGNALLLRAVPEVLKEGDPKPLLLDVLARLSEGPPPDRAAEAMDHVFATMACHSVVRAGDPMDREQALALLSQLDDVDVRSHCPHGRPVVVRITLSELERRFGRT